MNKKHKILSFSIVAKSYLSSRVVSESYSSSVIRVAKAVKSLTAEDVNAYLKRRMSQKNPSTVKHNRTILLTLWKYAYENDMINHMPKNIIKVKPRRNATKAWTIKDCENLVLKTFEKDSHKTKKGISIGVYLRC